MIQSKYWQRFEPYTTKTGGISDGKNPSENRENPSEISPKTELPTDFRRKRRPSEFASSEIPLGRKSVRICDGFVTEFFPSLLVTEFPTDFVTEFPSQIRHKCRNRKMQKKGFEPETSHSPAHPPTTSAPLLPQPLQLRLWDAGFEPETFGLFSLARVPLGQLVFHVTLYISIVYIF